MTTSKNFNELSGSSRVLFLMKFYSKVDGKKVWKMDFINEFFKEEIALANPGRIVSLMYEFSQDTERFTWDLVKDSNGNTSVSINNFNEPTQF